MFTSCDSTSRSCPDPREDLSRSGLVGDRSAFAFVVKTPEEIMIEREARAQQAELGRAPSKPGRSRGSSTFLPP
jgi:hypothetical protein